GGWKPGFFSRANQRDRAAGPVASPPTVPVRATAAAVVARVDNRIRAPDSRVCISLVTRTHPDQPCWINPAGSTPGVRGTLADDAYKGSRRSERWVSVADAVRRDAPSGTPVRRPFLLVTALAVVVLTVAVLQTAVVPVLGIMAEQLHTSAT